MKDHIESTVQWVWEGLAEAKIEPGHFHGSNKGALSLFAPTADFEAVFSTSDGAKKNPDVIRRLAAASPICSKMFETELLQIRRDSFAESVDQKLVDLAHLDFDEPALQGFKEASRKHVRELVRMGAKSFEKEDADIKFLSVVIKTEVESLHDEWEFRMLAVMVTTAINSGQLEMLPWERLCFDVGGVPGIRAHCKVPEACLAEVRSSRSSAAVALAAFKSSGDITLKEMVKVLSPRYKSIKKLDRKCWDLQWQFLESHVEPLVRQQIEAAMLATLPENDGLVTSKEAHGPMSICKF